MSQARGVWPPDEHGTGLIATLTGVAVFLLLILLGTQVLFDLYARSAVGAVAFDAARVVSGSDAGGTATAQATAEATARRELGRYGQVASFHWSVSDREVELSVTVMSPSLLPRPLAGALSLDRVERTVVIPREGAP